MCNKSNKCNECDNRIISCGCKDPVNLKCTYYKGDTLMPLQIEDDMDGETIIKIINDYLKDLIIDLQVDPTIIESIGTGSEIYKGLSTGFRHQIRSLVEGVGITIEETEEEIKISVSSEFLTQIESVGTGEEIFKGLFGGIHQFRSIGSSDDSVRVTTSGDGNTVDLKVTIPEIPTLDYPVIESEDIGDSTQGVSLRKDVLGKKIGIRRLQSPDFIILETPEGSIEIKSAGGGSNSTDWFLDVNFVRPSNWGQSQNPKEVITYSTSMLEIAPGIYTNGQEVKVPKGTLNDPFKTYEEYLLKRIYGAGGGGTGTPSKVNPRYPQMTLQILSGVTTASEIEVNSTILRLRNKTPIYYTGTREYAIDYKSIYDAMPVDGAGKALYPMINSIMGEGYITRETGFGLVRAKAGSKTLGAVAALDVVGEGDYGIIFQEGANLSNFVPIFKADGVTRLMNGGFEVSGWQGQPPVTPLILIEGVSPNWWTSTFNGTKVFIQTKTQVGIELKNKASLTSSADKFMYQVINQYIGYEKILLDTAAFTTEERALVNYYSPVSAPVNNPGIFYKPYDTYSIFKLNEETQVRIENLKTEANGFHAFAAMNTVEQANKSDFSVLVSLSNIGGGGTINLLKKYGSDGYFTMSNGQSVSPYFNLIEGDGTNNFTLNLKNISLTAKNYKKDINNLIIQAGGTLTSINGFPILSPLPIYANNTDALVDLVPGMLYKEVVTGVVKQVV